MIRAALLRWSRRRAAGQDIPGLPVLRGEKLGSGVFNEVWGVSDRLVVKVARSYGPFRQPLSWLVRNRAEHEQASRYLRVPATYHVRMRTRSGSPVSVILQHRLNGEVLAKVADWRLRQINGEVTRTVAALEKCCLELGWLPDVIGGPPRWGQHDLRRSNNLFVDVEGRIWLIDPGALFLWFSRRNIIGRVYTSILLRSGRRMVRRFGRS